MMTPMRNFLPAVALVLVSALTAVPAWAFQEPGTIKSAPGQGPGAIAALILVALIIGVSLMTPRRTHQD